MVMITGHAWFKKQKLKRKEEKETRMSIDTSYLHPLHGHWTIQYLFVEKSRTDPLY